MRAVMTVLPMAFVMVAGPQIVTAILLATSVRPRRDSAFFLLGAAAATTIGLTAAYGLTGLFQKAALHSGRDLRLEHAIDVAIVVLLVFLGIRVFRHRERAEPPRWMARLETATPGFALKIGFLLFLLMPGNLVSMATVGAYLARHDVAWWHCLIVAGVTVGLAGIPLLVLLVLGERAKAWLPKTRDWMTRNSWIVSEAVIAFFLLMTLKGLFEG
jgi:predicted membrane channel-forming protein YqfA (hemolysin III family)